MGGRAILSFGTVAIMILLDQPYVSQLLLQTIRKHELPVVATAAARAFDVASMPSAISEQVAVAHAIAEPDPLLYCVSESSIAWIAEHLAATGLPEQMQRFKNKTWFRERTASLCPGLRYREIALAELDAFDVTDFEAPFVIKPSVGFFSLGVRSVDSAAAWPAARTAIKADLASASSLFPGEVLDTSRLLLESYISGREFAVDAYFDANGQPVVLGILEHRFVGASDMSDRVYVTSAEIVRANLYRFTQFLAQMGECIPTRNFAMHVELRVDDEGAMTPIEVNPGRFGGWCTTADLTHHAFGINPYACFLRGARPNWTEALHGHRGEQFGLIALGNTTGIEGHDIEAFDYDGLCRRFACVLEMRKVDFRRYPIFGFAFTKTLDPSEFAWALQTDLREFVR